MATGQISRCRRLVAADLVEEKAEVLRETDFAGENVEVLRESEGEEASAAAEEEVFGLEISRCRRLVAADLAGENAEVLLESEGEEASAAAEEELFGLEEDPWPPDRSLDAVVSLQHILPEKAQRCFGRVKEKKPPPPRKRKCLDFPQVLVLRASVDVVDEKDY
ncbi:uncharacterized protein G2W53_015304 [Senna tora]|uniref:Uncharacterized protein n=1 Tax=Senna tora TaxID=362788 RepID=A0A834WV01_9FABA|nr:uncharacterized protein G2W53_015304 [Senna tora]